MKQQKQNEFERLKSDLECRINSLESENDQIKMSFDLQSKNLIEKSSNLLFF
jgi:hypothetical protein